MSELRLQNLQPEPERLELEERVKKLEASEAARNQPAARQNARRAAAKAELTELRKNPLPPGTRDPIRLERAAKLAELTAIAYGMEGTINHNGHFIPSPDPEAA